MNVYGDLFSQGAMTCPSCAAPTFIRDSRVVSDYAWCRRKRHGCGQKVTTHQRWQAEERIVVATIWRPRKEQEVSLGR